MRRRLTALFALLSLVASALVPAHVHGHARPARDGAPAGDLCVSGKPGAATPAAPDNVPPPACDMCSGCTGGAAAPPRAAEMPALPTPASRTLAAAESAGQPDHTPRAAFPRGPPGSR